MTILVVIESSADRRASPDCPSAVRASFKPRHSDKAKGRQSLLFIMEQLQATEWYNKGHSLWFFWHLGWISLNSRPSGFEKTQVKSVKWNDRSETQRNERHRTSSFNDRNKKCFNITTPTRLYWESQYWVQMTDVFNRYFLFQFFTDFLSQQSQQEHLFCPLHCSNSS